jgi:hypothetical protein
MAKKQREHQLAVQEPPVVPSPIIRANVSREVTLVPNAFSVYANDVQLQTTPWDIRLVFGVIASLPSEPTPVTTVGINQLGEVRLSPQLAKKLTMVLFEQLKAYETQFGGIPLPPD